MSKHGLFVRRICMPLAFVAAAWNAPLCLAATGDAVELLSDPGFSNGIKSNPLTVKTLIGTPDHRILASTRVLSCGQEPPNPGANTVWWMNQLGTYKDLALHDMGGCYWDNGYGGTLRLPSWPGQPVQLGLGSYKYFDYAYPRYWNEYYPAPANASWRPKQYPYPNAPKSFTGVVVTPSNNDISDFDSITDLNAPISNPTTYGGATFFRTNLDKYIFNNYIGLALMQPFSSPMNDLGLYSEITFSIDVKVAGPNNLSDKLGVPGFRAKQHGGSFLGNLFLKEKTPRVCGGITQPLRTVVLQVQLFSTAPYIGCSYDAATDRYVKKDNYASYRDAYLITAPLLNESCVKMGQRNFVSGDPLIPNQILYAIDSAEYIRPDSKGHLLRRGDDGGTSFERVTVNLSNHVQNAIDYLNQNITARDAYGEMVSCTPETMDDFKLSVFNLAWETNSLISANARFRNLSIKGILK